MTDPEPNETPGDAQKAPRLPAGLHFWWSAYCGTAVAGGVFGGALSGMVGIVMILSGHEHGLVAIATIPLVFGYGLLCATATAIPIVVTVAILTWMFWLSRFRLIFAGLAGGMTGAVAMRGPIGWRGFFGAYEFGLIFLAGVTGLIGSTVAGARANRRYRKLLTPVSENGVWQFTLRDLFWRMTVFAMLVGTWTWAIRSVYDTR